MVAYTAARETAEGILSGFKDACSPDADGNRTYYPHAHGCINAARGVILLPDEKQACEYGGGGYCRNVPSKPEDPPHSTSAVRPTMQTAMSALCAVRHAADAAVLGA